MIYMPFLPAIFLKISV